MVKWTQKRKKMNVYNHHSDHRLAQNSYINKIIASEEMPEEEGRKNILTQNKNT